MKIIQWANYFVLLSVTLLTLSPAVSWSQSTAESAPSGYCCVNGKISKISPRICKLKRGNAFKTLSEAKRRCKPAAIFCCMGGKIAKTSARQCLQRKGTAYKTSLEAKKKCKPANVYCCVYGKISKASARHCKLKRGSAYKTLSHAKSRCKPADVFCCMSGKVAKTSPKQCKQRKGTAYKSSVEAKARCKPTAIYCCIKGKTTKTSPSKCRQFKGIAYKTSIEAKRRCKPENGYCCSKDKVSQLGLQQCMKQKGRYYPARNLADKACKADNSYCCVKGKIVRKGNKECLLAKGSYSTSRIDAEKKCKQSSTGSVVGNKPLSPGLKPSVIPPGMRKPVSVERGANTVIPTAHPGNRRDILSGDEDKSNWTTISGTVRLEDGTFPGSSVVPQMIVIPQGFSNRENAVIYEDFHRNLTFDMRPDGSYQFTLPPGGSWKIQPRFANPLVFTENPYTFQTGELGETLYHNFTLQRTPAVGGYPEGNCTLRVTHNFHFDEIGDRRTVIDGFILKLDTLRGAYTTASRTIPLGASMESTIEVPHGYYDASLLFQGSSDWNGGFESQYIECDPHLNTNIHLHFTTHEYVEQLVRRSNSIYGKVTVNGKVNNQLIAGVQLEKVDTLEKMNTDINNSGNYAFSDLSPEWRERYKITVNVKEGIDYSPSAQIVEYYQNVFPNPINFDLNIPPTLSFGFLDLKEMVSDPNNPSAQPTIRLLLKTESRNHHQGETFRKRVRLTIGGNRNTRTCTFSQSSNTADLCEFRLPIGRVNTQTDSLTAEIVDDDNLSVSRVYPTPFKDLVGDLMAKSIVVYRASEGPHGFAPTRIVGHFENLGPARSQPCEAQLWIHRPDHQVFKKNIPAYEVGGVTSVIGFDVPHENLRVGDHIQFRFKDSCAGLRSNNVVQYTIEQDDVPPRQTTMTGESSLDWDDFNPLNWLD